MAKLPSNILETIFNLLRQLSELVDLATGTEYLLVSPIWSVSLELVFYIFAPFLIKRTTRTLSFVIVVLLFARAVIHLLGVNEDPWTYRFFPFELPIFLLGILLFRF